MTQEQNTNSESIKILEQIDKNCEISDVLNIIGTYKNALSMESTEKKLWHSPLDSIYFIMLLLLLLFGTILKFCTNTVWISIPQTYFSSAEKHVNFDFANLIIYGIWLVGPPLLFLIEYTFMFGKAEKNRMDPIQCADIKYCHDLASKIWAGVSVFLSVILALKYGLKV